MKDLEKLLSGLSIEKREKTLFGEKELVYVNQKIEASMLRKLIRTSKLACVEHYDSGLVLHFHK